MTARFVVPEGDAVGDHYCACGQPWDWCACPDEEAECGSFRFADCPLPLGHAGFCVDRQTEEAS